MSEVKKIQLANGRSIYVEMDHTDVPELSPPSGWKPKDLPAGAEPVGFKEHVSDAMQALQDNIAGLTETVFESLKSHQPEEWTIELNIGFKGTTSPIPVILSGEASGAIKVTAKWKK